MADVERWEYLRIHVGWDGYQRDWVCRFANREDIYGFDTILDYWGQYGWELVNVAPHKWKAPHSSRGYSGDLVEYHDIGVGAARVEQHQYRTLEWEVQQYLCIFKRRQ